VRLRLSLLFLALALAVGCAPRGGRGGGGGGGGNSGDDELVDDGTDTDGDGLTDMQEDELGTDPEDPDSDGDGYSDGAEVENDSDPTNDEDGIFQGGFPFNADLDGCEDSGFSGGASVGDQLPCAAFQTQFDEDYNLWNLRGSARYLVIDNSAVWCGPCNAMAEWLDGSNNGFIDPAGNPIREAVWDGTVRWVTAIYEDATGSPANLADLESWYQEYPTDNVLVLGDGSQQLISWIGPPGIPSLSLVDLDTMEMVIVDDTNGVLNAVMAAL